MGTPEDTVAATIAHHRARLALTYDQLAELMKVEGVSIHQSAIQKSEKSGRRVSIDEMVAYARIFGIPVEELWGGVGQKAEFASGWQALIDAESLGTIADFTKREYQYLIGMVAGKAGKDPALKSQIRDRLAKRRITAERKAKAQAIADGVDVSTADKREAYLWGMWADPAMVVCRDVLEAIDDGE